MSATLIKTDIPCPTCASLLCNLCGFNGSCEDCGADIDPETDEQIIDYVEQHRGRI